jgi:hypothetical protein
VNRKNKMLSKVVIFALALTAINCQVLYNKGIYGGYGSGLLGAGNLGLSSYSLGGIPALGGYYGRSVYGAGLGGLGYGYGAGLGLSRVGALGLGLGGVATKAVGLGGVGLLGNYGGIAASQAHAVNAAVQSLGRTVDYRAVPFSGEPIIPQVVDVPPTEQPVQLNFQSKSSPLIVSQTHIPGEPGQVQVTQSEDEPHRLVHTVNKPVIQEVNEVIQPYRQLTQEVNPVIEQAHTTVSQGEGAHITGLAGGIIGGSGLVGAQGLGVAVAKPAVAVGGLGLGAYGAGLGVRGVGLYGAGLGAYGAGLGGIYGARTLGLGGVYGAGLGYGLGYGSGIYGTGLLNSGIYGSRVFGTGLASPAFGGVYGTTAKITRF